MGREIRELNFLKSMPLSSYDIKRIASEIAANQNKDLSRKITKAVNDSVSELSEEWLTTLQACRILKMSERQLRKLKAEGEIPYSKPRGRVYFKLSDLNKFLSNTK